jgi:hypothetical protein
MLHFLPEMPDLFEIRSEAGFWEGLGYEDPRYTLHITHYTGGPNKDVQPTVAHGILYGSYSLLLSPRLRSNKYGMPATTLSIAS